MVSPHVIGRLVWTLGSKPSLWQIRWKGAGSELQAAPNSRISRIFTSCYHHPLPSSSGACGQKLWKTIRHHKTIECRDAIAPGRWRVRRPLPNHAVASRHACPSVETNSHPPRRKKLIRTRFVRRSCLPSLPNLPKFSQMCCLPRSATHPWQTSSFLPTFWPLWRGES